jgi:hypothetical protein
MKNDNLKKKIKDIVAIVAFIAIAFLTIILLYRALKWKDTNGEYLSSVEQLKNTDDNLVDVVFVGSSHVYCGIQPAYFWQDKGWSVFDMSVSGQDRNSSYYHLKNLLKTQSPQVVVVDLYGLTFDKHEVVANEYRNYLSLPTSPLSVKHVMSYFDKEDRTDYFVRFPIVHTRYRELAKYDFINYAPNKFGRGEYPTWEVGFAYPSAAADGPLNPAELDEDQIKWLDDMIALSEEEDFQLVFMVMPFASEERSQGIIDAACEYASERGIDTIDFNRRREELGFNYDIDFCDQNHLNAKGAVKVAHFFEEYLEDRFVLEDHKRNSDYHQWDEDTAWFKATRAEAAMAESGNLTEVVSILAANNDLVGVISLDGDSENYQGLFEPLSLLGIEYTEFCEGGKWVYENGVLERVCDNNGDADTFYKKLGTYDVLNIGYDSAQGKVTVNVNDTEYKNAGPGVMIIVYDKITDDTSVVKWF